METSLCFRGPRKDMAEPNNPKTSTNTQTNQDDPITKEEVLHEINEYRALLSESRLPPEIAQLGRTDIEAVLQEYRELPDYDEDFYREQHAIVQYADIKFTMRATEKQKLIQEREMHKRDAEESAAKERADDVERRWRVAMEKVMGEEGLCLGGLAGQDRE